MLAMSVLPFPELGDRMLVQVEFLLRHSIETGRRVQAIDDPSAELTAIEDGI
jgi:hypothetical protein